MIPYVYVDLVHKTAIMLAARHNHAAEHHESDRQLAERMEHEVVALLNAIRDQWVRDDAAAGRAASPGPDLLERLLLPRRPGARAWARPPGQTAVEFTTDEVLAEMVRLRRAGEDARFRRWHRVVAVLTGWADAEVAGRLAQAERDLAVEQVKGGAA